MECRDLPCDWPALRLEVLRRDGHRCRSCGNKRDRQSLEATPVRPGDYRLQALVTLCPACRRLIDQLRHNERIAAVFFFRKEDRDQILRGNEQPGLLVTQLRSNREFVYGIRDPLSPSCTWDPIVVDRSSSYASMVSLAAGANEGIAPRWLSLSQLCASGRRNHSPGVRGSTPQRAVGRADAVRELPEPGCGSGERS